MNNQNYRQCPRCQAQNEGENAYCYNCGVPFTAPFAEQNTDNTRKPPAPSAPAGNTGFNNSYTPHGGSGAAGAYSSVKTRKKGPIIAIAAAALVVVLAAVVIFAVLPAVRESQLTDRYNAAVELMEQDDFAAAEAEFLALEDYEDAASLAGECRNNLDYRDAVDLMDAGDYEGALREFEALGAFEDAAELSEECRDNIDYGAAVALMDAGDYEGAAAAFESLGSFRDSDALIEECRNIVNYDTGVALMDAGDYEGAIAAFEGLNSYEDSGALIEECRNIVDYAAADEAFTNGRYYDAWQGFSALGEYSDAAARADACRLPYPASSELYHSADFGSGASLTIITDSSFTMPTYMKVYTDSDELVSCVFLNAGAASATISLPSGDYRFRTASGEYWYGEEQMFGSDGYYQSLLFDGDNDIVYLDASSGPYELTLGGVVDGNVGSRNIDPEDF